MQVAYRDQRCFEEIRVFHEEWPLLRKENFEPLVYRVLRLVRLHLRKIRIHRRIQHQAVVEDELRIQSRLSPKAGRIKSRLRRIENKNKLDEKKSGGDKPTLRTRTETQPPPATTGTTGSQQPQAGGDDSDPDRQVLKKRTDDGTNPN